MTYETVQVFSGSPITPEELLVLAEFAAPSHFVSNDHLRDRRTWPTGPTTSR